MFANYVPQPVLLLDPTTLQPVAPAGAGSGTAPTETAATLTAGGTAQNALPVNTARKGVYLSNTSTGDLTVRLSGTASSTAGVVVPAGGLYESPSNITPTAAVSVWGATTGQTYLVAEW